MANIGTGISDRATVASAFISQFGIRKTLAKEILGDVVRAVARWKTVAKQLGFTSREVDSFANAFEHEERRSAAKLL